VYEESAVATRYAPEKSHARENHKEYEKKSLCDADLMLQ